MDPQYLNFQKNLKTTAVGVSFAKRLYMNPDSITDKQALAVLKELGFPISKDLQLTVQATQAIVSGAAVVDRAQSLNSFTDYKEIVKPGTNSIAALNSVARELKLIDGETSTLLAVGLDVACIFASGGADIGAWVRVAMAVGQESMKVQATAQMEANKSLAASVQSYIKGEQDLLVKNITDLQAGKLGLFSFLAASVKDIPLLFPTVIGQNPAFEKFRDIMPGLQFLPTGPWVFQAQGSATTWYGDKKSADARYEMQGLRVAPGTSGIDYLINFIIWRQASFLMSQRREWLRRGCADIYNVALFALFEKDFYIRQEMDLLQKFVQYQVSPYEIGERETFNTAIDTNAVAVTTSFGQSLGKKALTGSQMRALDQTGNIEALRSDSQAAALIRKKFNFGPTTAEIEAKGFIDSSFDVRNIANFIAILDFLDLIYTDVRYQELKKQSTLLGHLEEIPRLNLFKAQFSDIYTSSMIRRVNRTALLNVANMSGIPLSKLQANQRAGQPTIFKGI